MRRSSVLLVLVALSGALALGLGRSSASAQPAHGALGSGLVRPALTRVGPVVAELEQALRKKAAEQALEARLAAHVRDMPDLTQTDPELGVAGGGESWCGPVAVSNALVWLGEHGREGLLPSGADAHDRQLALVRKLGSPRYMGTTPTGGTGTANLLTGLHAFLRDSGYGYKRLQYEGWRGHPARFTTRVRIADLDFIRRGLSDGGVAVIHAGWYHPSPYGDFYRRKGGHWLTVVGVGIDAEGRDAPNALVLNDPAPYAGDTPSHSFVTLTRLESGWLLAEDGAFPAKGYETLGGGMKIKRDGDIAVLDGAVVLVP
jgi:hypothetical protein